MRSLDHIRNREAAEAADNILSEPAAAIASESAHDRSLDAEMAEHELPRSPQSDAPM